MKTALDEIVARTARENARRHAHSLRPGSAKFPGLKPDEALRALRRPAGDPIRVIAEIKFRSPSAGTIRSRQVGTVEALARDLSAHGAAAVSILADRPAFGGSVLDVRRGASQVEIPVLFKGFVLDEIQLDVAKAAGASLVLLLVRCLEQEQLEALVAGARARGLVPLVEAMDEPELGRAIRTGAAVVGVNARDLGNFDVDVGRAERVLSAIPQDRVAVQMSGLKSREDVARAAAGRADAVLVGEGLMRADNPGFELASWLS